MGEKIIIPLLLVSLWVPCQSVSQEFYKTTAVKTEFFSSAPVEDIHAVSREGISVLNTETGEISFQINIKNFEFRKAKMREHFNENFMESHKYAAATFKGNIRENIGFTREGEFNITLTGILDIHGVKQNREIPSTIKILNDQVNLKSEFKVACKDHDITIPQILWRNIAEVVRVQVNANYTKL